MKKNPIIISIMNRKGGVGKTTITVNLAAALAESGNSVLAIDLDSQSNLTHSLIGDVEEEDLTIGDAILKDTNLEKIIKKTPTKNLFIAPSSDRMADLELNITNEMGRENLLYDALDNKILQKYNYILLDNPPSLNLILALFTSSARISVKQE